MLIGFDAGPLYGNSDAELLRNAGCDRIYSQADDVFSFDDVIRFLRPGDVVVVVALARVGNDVKQVVSSLNKVHLAGATLQVANTEIAPQSALGESFAKVCAIIADNLVNGSSSDPQRQCRKRRGRPVALAPETEVRAERLLRARRLTVAEIAQVLGVSPATIYRRFPHVAARTSQKRA